MLVSNNLLIKTLVAGTLLFCFMSDMLCQFANGENQHLEIESFANKRTCLKITTIFFEALICNCLVSTVITQLNQQTYQVTTTP